MSVTVSQLVQKIVIQGDTEAKAKLSGMHKAAEETSGGFKSMLGNALSFAGGLGIFNLASQAVGFLKDQIKDTIDVTIKHADVMKQTNDVITSTGGAAGMTAKSVNELAESLSRSKIYTADATQEGENLLLTFTNIGSTVMPQATSVMLDLSKAMGQDVKSSAIQMGKALNDPEKGITALTRVGVTFTQQQKDQIKAMQDSGNMAGAQTIILKELNKEFGGSADASKSFGGQMDLLKNRMEDFKVKIGTAVMPILTQFLGWLTANGLPILERFGDWFTNVGVPAIQHFGDMVGKVWKILDDEGLGILIASFQNLANTIGNDLSPVLKLIGDMFKNIFSDNSIISGAHNIEGSFYNIAAGIDVVNGDIKQLTAFFQSNSIQAQIVKDLMIGIGVAIAAIGIGAFVLAIPAIVTAISALVVGFIAWAVAAGAAAIATIAATWPILAIGAIIAIVVAGIILAIQHWGDISKWLQGVWSAFSAWFMGALGTIGNFFVGVWNGIIAFLQAAWNFIVNVIKIGALLALAVLFAPIIAMAALFIWLYNHNYYFKALVDAIVNFFVGCFNWCRDNWQSFVSWLAGLWQGVVGIASAAWGAVSGAVVAVVSFVVGWLVSQWSATIGFLGALWGTISGYASRAWNAVVGVFQGVWGTISGILGGLWTSFSTWFSNLAGQFLTWGGNVIAQFIQGIEDKIGQIGATLAHAADVVKNFLGFHSPTKEGPGKEADTWAPNFVKMYAAGLEAGIPQIESVVSRLMNPISMSLAPGTMSGGVSLPAISQPSSSSQGDIILQIDGRTFARLTLPYTVSEIRNTVGIRI